MFDNLKKKLRGILGKAKETVEEKPIESPPVLVEESKPPEPEPVPETHAQIEKELLAEVEQELEKEAQPTLVEEPTKAEEEIREKVEEALEAPIEETKPPVPEEKSFAEKIKGAILDRFEEKIEPEEELGEFEKIAEQEKEAEKVGEEIVGKFEEKIETPAAEDFKEEVPPSQSEGVWKRTPSTAEGGTPRSPSLCVKPLPEENFEEAPKLDTVPPKIEVEDEEPRDEKAETVTIEVEKPAVIEEVRSLKKPEHKPREAIGHLEEEVEEKNESGILKLFSKITHKELAEKDVAPVLWELEIALLENDVAKEVAEKIIFEVKEALLSKKVKRGTVEEIIKAALKKSVTEILGKEPPDLLKLVEQKKEKPFVILFFGFNGTGKTMTIGKFAKMLKDNGYTVVMAAGDTFRAAAIEQLEVHATNLGVPIIKQKKGADSAAVIFDAIKYAKAKNIDVVLADTAGRSHTNTNLMDELRKIVRVAKPDFKIFVGDSLTGNDAAEQAKLFSDAVGIDGSVLTKIDTDPKGGACLSVAYMTKQPILYLGNGQKYEDLIDFSAKWFLDKVF